MKNYEKYKDLVIECVEEDSICRLANEAFGTTECDNRTCKYCAEFTAGWLNRECIEIEWEKVPVDTPVIIKAKDGIMFRHFAKYYHGHVYVYASGKTSWTNDGETQPWEPDHVKFGVDEDSAKYAKQ